MTLTIEFPPEVDARLQRAAQARGLDPAGLVRRLVEENLPAPQENDLRELFAAWEAEDSSNDPAELAARRAECEEFLRNLEANRLSLPVPKL